MKHDFILNDSGKIDIFVLDEAYHNGPGCRRCDGAWCHHCDSDIYEKECPSGQLELPLDTP